MKTKRYLKIGWNFVVLIVVAIIIIVLARKDYSLHTIIHSVGMPILLLVAFLSACRGLRTSLSKGRFHFYRIARELEKDTFNVMRYNAPDSDNDVDPRTLNVEQGLKDLSAHIYDNMCKDDDPYDNGNII